MKKKFNYKKEKDEVIKRLTKEGLDKEQSEIVADCFVTADLYGVTSHGCAITNAHIQKMKRGGYNLKPEFKILRKTGAFAVVDGDNALGPVSAKFCLDLGIKECKESGVYTVFSRNNNTFGPAFYYSLKAAEQGCIAFVCSNSPAQMPLYGGKEKMLGTNPFAVVIPVPGKDPIIIDMATSIVAKSKFKEYKMSGEKLPDGWALDKYGNPTNDPDEGMEGFVLPMAGFKGLGIAILIDIMAGLMSGAAYLNRVGRFYSEDNLEMNVGYYYMVMDPEIVIGEQYSSLINEYVEVLRSSEHLPGHIISIPGDDRNACYRRNVKDSDIDED